MKKITIILFALLLLATASAAYTISKSEKTKITEDILLEQIKDCETTTWTETAPEYGTCTDQYETIACSDPPLNKSCAKKQETREYKCKTGEKQIEKSKELCKDTKMNVKTNKKDYTLNYGDWGKCSYKKEQNVLVITCDSKYDGNGDGICKPGESCVQFRITKDDTQVLEKNSRMDFVESDKSFFLDKLKIDEVTRE